MITADRSETLFRRTCANCGIPVLNKTVKGRQSCGPCREIVQGVDQAFNAFGCQALVLLVYLADYKP